MNDPRRSNGSTVSRAELGAHLDRIDGQIQSLHDKMDALTQYVRTPPRWAAARLNAVIDRGLIIAVTAVLAYIATHS